MDKIQLQIDLTNLVLAFIAVVALVAAWRQLKTMQSDSETQIEIARQQEYATRASVLLSLDERFASQSMKDARSEMAALRDRVIQKADQTWPALAIKARRDKGAEFYADELEKMRQGAQAPYIHLMTACSFFETVGYVTYSKYVPLEDILKLFGTAINQGGIVFEAHLNKLRDDVYQDDTLYANFLWLIKESRKAVKDSKKTGV